MCSVMTNLEIINVKNYVQAKKEVQKERIKGNQIAIKGEKEQEIRKLLEKEENVIYLLSLKKEKDYQKQRNTGYNQVLAKILKKKGSRIGICQEDLLSEKEQWRLLARMRQTIYLCNKYNVEMSWLMKEKEGEAYNLRALCATLGMSPSLQKRLKFISE